MKNFNKYSSFKKSTISQCGAFSLLMMMAAQANALDISLCAGETVKTMADNSTVKVWGYGYDNGSAACDTATVPGPKLTIPVADTDLNITLRNTLSAPVSIIIPGMQATAGNVPVFLPPDSEGRRRVRSLATETVTGASTTYSFAAKAGTFLYQSGTHAAVQVQMGLYGASTKDSAAGEAYPGVGYDSDVVLLYSEIDPAMHDAIAGTVNGAAATYGTTGPTSTIGYKARYYLVNGNSFVAGSTLSAGDKGSRILLRFLNAGLESHAPMLQGQHMNLVAEYGHAYPFAREQYSVLLAAGATKDAVFTPASGGNFPLYDRRLRLTNSAQLGAGGLMSILSVIEPVILNPVIASSDSVITPEDVAATVAVLANDTSGAVPDATSVQIAAQATNGNAIVEATGDITYTPNADFNGADSFSYTVRNADGVMSNAAAVSVGVTPVNDSPVARNDAYAVVMGSITTLNVLANDFDVDMDPLTTTVLVANDPLLGGVVIPNIDGSFDYTAGTVAGNDSFTYTLSDGVLSTTATVDIAVSSAVNEAPVAVDDYATVSRNTGTLANSVTIVVTANDADPDGTLDLASVVIDTQPRNGSVTVDALSGNISYTPKAGYRGSDAFSYTINDNNGLSSNIATVRVDVLK